MSEKKKPTCTPRDGNAFSILGAASKALRRAGVPEEEIKAYRDRATAGDYDHLLQETMRVVDLEV